jgi:hypothetical protein
VRTWRHDPFPARKLIGTLLAYATPLIFLAVFIYFGLQSPASCTRKHRQHRQAGVLRRHRGGRHDLRAADGRHRPLGRLRHVSRAADRRLRHARVRPRRRERARHRHLVGPILGAINAFLIVRLRIIPFIVTLATLFFFRGAAPS